jgi:hypothetical protein
MLRAMTVAIAVASTTARAATTTTTPRVLPHYTAAARRCTASQGACSARTLVRSAANGDSSSSSSYEVYPVIGDGRCLFRSIAVGRALAEIGERAEEIQEVIEADVLRAAAVDELLERREDTEWFIEGDFEQYCARMQAPSTWGGEPEILMLTHVLASPISVFMEVSGELKSIGVYGEEYAESGQYDNLAVLFHGAGHYEALRLI